MMLTEVDNSQVRAAYELILAEWPDIIEPGEKSFHIDGGCNMRKLNETHDQIENWASETEFAPELDEIIGSLEWSVFQTVHSALQNLSILRKLDIDFEAVLSRFDGHPNYKVNPDAKN